MTWSRRPAVGAGIPGDRDERDDRGGPGGPGAAVLVALVQVIGTALASRGESGPGVVGYVLLVVGGLALADRHRFPRVTAVVVAALTVVYHGLGNPVGFTTVLAAVFAAGACFEEGHPLAAWAVAAASFGALVPLGGEPLTLAAWLLGAGILLQVLVRLGGLAGRMMTEQRRLYEERQRRQVSDERLRIAQELHDVLGHHLSLINVRAGVGLHLMARQPEQAQAALDAIQQTSAEALREVQSVLTVLYPTGQAAPRAPTPGLDRLDDLTLDAGIPVHATIEGDERPVSAEIGRAAYRIVQEALTNVRRHAGSDATATILIDYGPAELTVRVDDDGGGRPVPATEPVAGNGITGMRERTTALGGTVGAGRTGAGGWRVDARFPLLPEVSA
jgi:signal transduction histidine kinase